MGKIVNKAQQKKSRVNFISATFKNITGGLLEYTKEYLPGTTSVIEDSKEIFEDVKKTTQNTSGSVLSTFRSIAKLVSFKTLFNWYMDQGDQFGDTGGIGEDDLNFDIGGGDNSSSSSDSLSDSTAKEVGSAEIKAVEKGTDKVAKTVLDTSQKMAELQVASLSHITNSLEKTNSIITSGFESVNNTLKDLIKVVSENTSSLIKLVSIGREEESSYSSKREFGMEDVLRGNFKFKDYFGYLKNKASNIGGMAEMALSMIGMIGSSPEMAMSMLQDQKKEWIKQGINWGIEKAFPGFSRMLKNLETKAGEWFSDALINLGKGRNPFTGKEMRGWWRSIGDFLGVTGGWRGIRGTQLDSFEQKRISFDTETKESITKVIPGYLREITKALTKKDLVYSYEKRSFMTTADYKKEYIRQVGQAVHLDIDTNSGHWTDKQKQDLQNNAIKQKVYLILDQMIVRAANGYSSFDELLDELNLSEADIKKGIFPKKMLTSLGITDKMLADDKNKVLQTQLEAVWNILNTLKHDSTQVKKFQQQSFRSASDIGEINKRFMLTSADQSLINQLIGNASKNGGVGAVKHYVNNELRESRAFQKSLDTYALKLINSLNKNDPRYTRFMSDIGNYFINYKEDFDKIFEGKFKNADELVNALISGEAGSYEFIKTDEKFHDKFNGEELYRYKKNITVKDRKLLDAFKKMLGNIYGEGSIGSYYQNFERNVQQRFDNLNSEDQKLALGDITQRKAKGGTVTPKSGASTTVTYNNSSTTNIDAAALESFKDGITQFGEKFSTSLKPLENFDSKIDSIIKILDEEINKTNKTLSSTVITFSKDQATSNKALIEKISLLSKMKEDAEKSKTANLPAQSIKFDGVQDVRLVSDNIEELANKFLDKFKPIIDTTTVQVATPQGVISIPIPSEAIKASGANAGQKFATWLGETFNPVNNKLNQPVVIKEGSANIGNQIAEGAKSFVQGISDNVTPVIEQGRALLFGGEFKELKFDNEGKVIGTVTKTVDNQGLFGGIKNQVSGFISNIFPTADNGKIEQATQAVVSKMKQKKKPKSKDPKKRAQEEEEENQRISALTVALGAVGGGLFGGPVGCLLGAMLGATAPISNIGLDIKHYLFGNLFDKDAKPGEVQDGLIGNEIKTLIIPFKLEIKKTLQFAWMRFKRDVLGPFQDFGAGIAAVWKKTGGRIFKSIADWYKTTKMYKWTSGIVKGFMNFFGTAAGKLWGALKNGVPGILGLFGRTYLGAIGKAVSASGGLINNILGRWSPDFGEGVRASREKRDRKYLEDLMNPKNLNGLTISESFTEMLKGNGEFMKMYMSRPDLRDSAKMKAALQEENEKWIKTRAVLRNVFFGGWTSEKESPLVSAAKSLKSIDKKTADNSEKKKRGRPKNEFNALLDAAMKAGIISEDDLNELKKIRSKKQQEARLNKTQFNDNPAEFIAEGIRSGKIDAGKARSLVEQLNNGKDEEAARANKESIETAIKVQAAGTQSKEEKDESKSFLNDIFKNFGGFLKDVVVFLRDHWWILVGFLPIVSDILKNADIWLKNSEIIKNKDKQISNDNTSRALRGFSASSVAESISKTRAKSIDKRIKDLISKAEKEGKPIGDFIKEIEEDMYNNYKPNEQNYYKEKFGNEMRISKSYGEQYKKLEELGESTNAEIGKLGEMQTQQAENIKQRNALRRERKALLKQKNTKGADLPKINDRITEIDAELHKLSNESITLADDIKVKADKLNINIDKTQSIKKLKPKEALSKIENIKSSAVHNIKISCGIAISAKIIGDIFKIFLTMPYQGRFLTEAEEAEKAQVCLWVDRAVQGIIIGAMGSTIILSVTKVWWESFLNFLGNCLNKIKVGDFIARIFDKDKLNQYKGQEVLNKINKASKDTEGLKALFDLPAKLKKAKALFTILKNPAEIGKFLSAVIKKLALKAAVSVGPQALAFGVIGAILGAADTYATFGITNEKGYRIDPGENILMVIISTLLGIGSWAVMPYCVLEIFMDIVIMFNQGWDIDYTLGNKKGKLPYKAYDFRMWLAWKLFLFIDCFDSNKTLIKTATQQYNDYKSITKGVNADDWETYVKAHAGSTKGWNFITGATGANNVLETKQVNPAFVKSKGNGFIRPENVMIDENNNYISFYHENKPIYSQERIKAIAEGQGFIRDSSGNIKILGGFYQDKYFYPKEGHRLKGRFYNKNTKDPRRVLFNPFEPKFGYEYTTQDSDLDLYYKKYNDLISNIIYKIYKNFIDDIGPSKNTDGDKLFGQWLSEQGIPDFGINPVNFNTFTEIYDEYENIKPGQYEASRVNKKGVTEGDPINIDALKYIKKSLNNYFYKNQDKLPADILAEKFKNFKNSKGLDPNNKNLTLDEILKKLREEDYQLGIKKYNEKFRSSGIKVTPEEMKSHENIQWNNPYEYNSLPRDDGRAPTPSERYYGRNYHSSLFNPLGIGIGGGEGTSIANKKSEIDSSSTVAPASPVNSEYAYPVENWQNAIIRSKFNEYRYKGHYHGGIDIAFPGDKGGQKIISASDGILLYSGWQNPNNQQAGYGRMVVIKDPKTGNKFIYGHLEKINSEISKLPNGAKIKKGAILGTMGTSGSSTGPHLHFEIRKGEPGTMDDYGNEGGNNGATTTAEITAKTRWDPEKFLAGKASEVSIGNNIVTAESSNTDGQIQRKNNENSMNSFLDLFGFNIFNDVISSLVSGKLTGSLANPNSTSSESSTTTSESSSSSGSITITNNGNISTNDTSKVKIDENKLPEGILSKQAMKYLYKRLRESGFTHAAAVGVLANIHAESQFDANVGNKDGSGATGLNQWMGNRLTVLNKYDKDPKNRSYVQQVEFLLAEMGLPNRFNIKTGYENQYYKGPEHSKYNIDEYMKLTNPEEAALEFEEGNTRLITDNQRLGPNGIKDRQALAKKYAEAIVDDYATWGNQGMMSPFSNSAGIFGLALANNLNFDKGGIKPFQGLFGGDQLNKTGQDILEQIKLIVQLLLQLVTETQTGNKNALIASKGNPQTIKEIERLNSRNANLFSNIGKMLGRQRPFNSPIPYQIRNLVLGA